MKRAFREVLIWMREIFELSLMEYENVRQDLEMMGTMEHGFVDGQPHTVHIMASVLFGDFSIIRVYRV